MYFALAPWEWRDVGGMSWNGPTGFREALDLRPRLKRAAAGGAAEYGIFTFDRDPSGIDGLTVLGDDPDETIRAAARTLLASALGVSLETTRLGDICFELVTNHADANDLLRAPPIIPGTRDPRLKFGFGTVEKAEAFDINLHPHGPKVKALLTRDYVALYDREPTRARKVLGAWVQRFPGLNYRDVQNNKPDEEPLDPETTYTETFPGTSGTLGGDYSWTEINGTWANVSGEGTIAYATADHHARLDNDLSSSDHDVTMDVVSMSTSHSNDSIGLAGRYSSSANDCYVGWYYSAFEDLFVSSITGGSRSNLSNVDGISYAAAASGFAAALTIDGSDISFSDGTNTINYNSASLFTSNVRAGIFSVWADSVFDNFVAADLAGSSLISIPQGDLALSTSAPSMVATGSLTVSVPSSNLALSAVAPSVERTTTTSVSVEVPQAGLVLSTSAPTVDKTTTTGVSVEVPQANLALAALAPTVAQTTNADISVPQANLTLSPSVPTLAVGASIAISVPQGDVVLSPVAPAVGVTGHVVASVPQASLTLTALLPSVAVSSNILVNVPQGDLALSAIAPDVASATGPEFEVPAGDLVLSGSAPALEAGTTLLIQAGVTYEVYLQERPGGPMRLKKIVFTGS